jgi:hypothetical protein
VLSAAEQDFVSGHAYVPEHLPGYVSAIFSAEPYLIHDYLCYRGGRSIVLVGYPLASRFEELALQAVLEAAVSRFRPDSVAVTAPSVSMLGESCRARGSDRYYRLDLSEFPPHRNAEQMVRRASRELRIEDSGRIGEEHTRLIAEFLDSRRPGEEAGQIIQKIPLYLSSMPTARLFSARDRSGRLVAFDVAEFGAAHYAFYQFNIRSRDRHVPGASDLLLHRVVRVAQELQKRYVNLGLGIDEGITHFKTKWGASPFLDYEYCRYSTRRPGILDALLQKP